MTSLPNFSLNKLRDYSLFTALVTPFRNGKVDFEGLEFLLKLQEKAGNGVVLLGSTGEGFSLSFEEKKAIVAHALTCVREIPLIVSATGHNVASLDEHIKWLNEHLIQGIMVSLPPYYRPGPAGQIEWFETVFEKSRHPVLMYNHPGRTGIAIDPQVIHHFKYHPAFFALKQSSNSEEQLKVYQQAAPTLPIYMGDDSLMSLFGPKGIKGLISVMANAWPEETKTYVDLCLHAKGKNLDFFPVLEQASNPLPIKALLGFLYPISSEVRAPLSLNDIQSIESIEECAYSGRHCFVRKRGEN